jgi:hypothetical protein
LQLPILKAPKGISAEQTATDTKPLPAKFTPDMALAVVGRLGSIPLCGVLGWI